MSTNDVRPFHLCAYVYVARGVFFFLFVYFVGTFSHRKLPSSKTGIFEKVFRRPLYLRSTPATSYSVDFLAFRDHPNLYSLNTHASPLTRVVHRKSFSILLSIRIFRHISWVFWSLRLFVLYRGIKRNVCSSNVRGLVRVAIENQKSANAARRARRASAAVRFSVIPRQGGVAIRVATKLGRTRHKVRSRSASKRRDSAQQLKPPKMLEFHDPTGRPQQRVVCERRPPRVHVYSHNTLPDFLWCPPDVLLCPSNTAAAATAAAASQPASSSLLHFHLHLVVRQSPPPPTAIRFCVYNGAGEKKTYTIYIYIYIYKKKKMIIVIKKNIYIRKEITCVV
jgi:hypothetical protein